MNCDRRLGAACAACVVVFFALGCTRSGLGTRSGPEPGVDASPEVEEPIDAESLPRPTLADAQRLGGVDDPDLDVSHIQGVDPRDRDGVGRPQRAQKGVRPLPQRATKKQPL